MITQTEVNANPTCYSFKMGLGYEYLGPPRIPSNPVGPATACEPPAPAAKGSWHFLIPPNQPAGVQLSLRWDPLNMTWTPPVEAQGRRIAFTSEYMAANGWIYGSLNHAQR
jgi:hypothetical protein